MSTADDAGAEAARPTVFLSYSRTDQTRATQLAEALAQAGLNVWWDALIEGGAAFAKTIEDALTQLRRRHRRVVGDLRRLRLGAR